MKIVFDKAGYNINTVKWTASTSPVAIRMLSATAANDTTLRLTYNKALATSTLPSSADFKISSASGHPISRVVYDPADANSILIYSQNNIFYTEALTVDYSGTNLHSAESEAIPTFTNKIVLNKIAPRYLIAGKIESENFSVVSGIETETCSDTGGGLDIGYTSAGDYMDYPVYVQNAGSYNLTFRMAGNGGKASLYYADAANSSFIGSVTFSATGGWQIWQDFKGLVSLTAGAHTLRVKVDTEGFNLNYMAFVQNTTAVESHKTDDVFAIYPNPVNDEFTLAYTAESNLVRMDIFNMQGRIVLSDLYTNNVHINTKYSVRNLQQGVYLVKITDGGKQITRKLVVE